MFLSIVFERAAGASSGSRRRLSLPYDPSRAAAVADSIVAYRQIDRATGRGFGLVQPPPFVPL